MNFSKKNNKGSAIVITMVAMGIILAIGMSLALMASRERRASIGEGRSNLTYQDAETGVEKVMVAIKSLEDGRTATEILSFKVVNIDWHGHNLQCTHVSQIEERTSPTRFRAELQDEDGDPINCNSGSINLTDVKFIKSVGEGDSQERAIQAAVSHASNIP